MFNDKIIEVMTERNLYKLSFKIIETDEITHHRIVAMTMHEAVEYAEKYQKEQELGEIIAIEWQDKVLVDWDRYF